MREIATHKTCKVCKESFPTEKFFRYANGYLYPYCSPCRSALAKKWRFNNPGKLKASLAYHSEKRKEYRKDWRQERRQKVIELLGSICVKCGFSDARALQIDHVNGGGNRERIELGSNPALYSKILKQGTSGYQLLCANCNWIKRSEKQEYRAFTPTITCD